MAGMLPGVECARRRRCHQGGAMDSQGLNGVGRARRFCLYASNYESLHISNSLLQRTTSNQNLQVCELEGAARVAKERLDERLRFQQKSESKSSHGKESTKMDALCAVKLGLQMEVYGSKKKNSKRFTWGRFGLKVSREDECAVCLERFKGGETLVHLHCAHRFHSRCLVPWLVNNAHCPCCRTDVMA